MLPVKMQTSSAPPAKFACAISIIEQEMINDITTRITDADVLPMPLARIVVGYVAVVDLDQRLWEHTHKYHRFISDCVRVSLRISNEYNYQLMRCNKCGFGKPHLDFMISTFLFDNIIGCAAAGISIDDVLRFVADGAPIKIGLSCGNPRQSEFLKNICEHIGIPAVHMQMTIDSMVAQFRNELR